jgi:hypothetical protein
LNEEALRKTARDRIERAASSLRRADGIDCDALEALFEKEDFGTQFFELRISRHENRPTLLVKHRPNSGETADQIEDSASLFQQILRDLRPPRQWIRFRVDSDSFEVYLAARKILERSYKKFSAGWQPVLKSQPYVLDLRLSADLACSGAAVAKPLSPEPDKLNDKRKRNEPKEDPFVARLKKSGVKAMVQKQIAEKGLIPGDAPKNAAPKDAAQNASADKKPVPKDAKKNATSPGVADQKDAATKLNVKAKSSPPAPKNPLPDTSVNPSFPNDDID